MGKRYLFLLLFLIILKPIQAQTSLGSYASHVVQERQVVFTSQDSARLSLKAYSNHTVRIQVARKGEEIFPDDHYEMVAEHTLRGALEVQDKGAYFLVRMKGDGIFIQVDKQEMKLVFGNTLSGEIFLQENQPITWEYNSISTHFQCDTSENFCGLGHQAYGLVPSINLKGQRARSNYGDYDYSIDPGGWMAQANLNVPFYMSGKGYGLFVNSTYPNQFSFGKNGRYDFLIKGRGYPVRMDYFVILGPKFADILDQYTQLTGRPRLPQKSMFGLQLSDKDTPDNEGVTWWKSNILAHRKAGFPLDHIVNDNRWRAGSGGWSGSWFEWDKTRYPDPAEYNAWCKKNGLTMTLDLNRNVGSASWGWDSAYQIPYSKCVKENFSVPDYSSPKTRDWVWALFWKKSFDPALHYPGDALWMDEIDELICLPDSTPTQDGRHWAENRNYYPFLVAKAVVQQGWDNANRNQPAGIGAAKRPFMWGRGSTAGAQRYATHWSGDLKADYAWMQGTIRGMQASGLSGFPYFNHDAGGFREPGPDDAMYIQWAMAMGSFSPIWRPHGAQGSPRWPLRRSQACQDAAHAYGRMRYEMMPYIYTAAWNAYAAGLPMARAMVVDYQYQANAWKFDLQYMWGASMLVAPQTTGKDSTYAIWLPDGQKWYYLWDDKVYDGGQVVQHPAKLGELPVFVKAGAIIPKYHYAPSTFFQHADTLVLDVYSGKNGSYDLVEDDGVTELYQTGQKRVTKIFYSEKAHSITITAAKGTYAKAPASRRYEVRLHHAGDAKGGMVNAKKLLEKTGFRKEGDILLINTDKLSVDKEAVIQLGF